MMNAETTHELGKWFFKQEYLWSLSRSYLKFQDEVLHTTVGGVNLKSPFGLSAGWDKNCELIASMSNMGFGYLTPGTVMPHSREGNPRPRIVRYAKKQSLGNALGLPSEGVERALERLKHKSSSVPIFPSIGGYTVEEIDRSHSLLEPEVDGIELSLRCPNVYDKEASFMEPENLSQLLSRINDHRKKALFVRVPSHHNPKDRENRLDLIDVCLKNHVDALTLSGTRKIEEKNVSVDFVNLTGKDILSDSIRIVHDIYKATEGKIPIKSSGGVFTARDAFRMIKAGASTVEILTALVYEGWSVVRNLNRGLANLLREEGYTSLQEARGVLKTIAA